MDDEKEVEDIMHDQVIISTEVDFTSKSSSVTISVTKLRFVVALFTEALVPTVVGVYYAYLRNQKNVVENVRRQLWPTFLAFLANSISRSLSSVQRITFPLKLKHIKSTDEQSSTGNEADETETEGDSTGLEKSVECLVLAEPKNGVCIKADVIFIHGLHGSLPNTWKQGVWRHKKHPLRNETLGRRSSTGNFEFVPRLKKAVKRTGSFPQPSILDDSSSSPMKMPRTDFESDDFALFTTEEQHLTSAELLSEGSSELGYTPCWPKDWLPLDCPGVRVIALNYSTDPYLWRPVWIKKRNRTNMVERSQEMIHHLLNLNVGNHPIVWVGHSKGGLFIKQIITHSYDNKNNRLLSKIYIQSKGILFYSVPHKGSILADFNLPLLRKSIELTEIQKNYQFILNLHDKFMKLLDNDDFKPEIFSFIETSFTLMSFVFMKIVAFDSADPGVGNVCGVPLDHREICKPAGRDCFLYRELVRIINSISDITSAQCVS